MVYFSHLWQHTFRFASLPFQLDKWLFRLPQGWKISFNFAVRYTVDNAAAPPSMHQDDRYFREYSPLDETRIQIRLLKIHPGKPQDQIRTSLLMVDFASSPPYEALSYVWGRGVSDSAVLVNGHSSKVSKNLRNAIHALRHRDVERLLWIDALCINQSDLMEKSHQVRMMGDIYEGARSVVVYVGESTQATAEGMRALQYLVTTGHKLDEPPWSHQRLQEFEVGLHDILTREWFDRVWTVQEAVLARHTSLVCGEHKISWHGDLRTLRAIVFRIKSVAISPYFSSTRVQGRRHIVAWFPLLDVIENQLRQAARREGVTLQRNQLDLAFQFRYRSSTDGRDKYFALFGIAENEKGGDLKFMVDYTKTLEEVHQQYTEELQRISEIEEGEAPSV